MKLKKQTIILFLTFLVIIIIGLLLFVNISKEGKAGTPVIPVEVPLTLDFYRIQYFYPTFIDNQYITNFKAKPNFPLLYFDHYMKGARNTDNFIESRGDITPFTYFTQRYKTNENDNYITSFILSIYDSNLRKIYEKELNSEQKFISFNSLEVVSCDSFLINLEVPSQGMQSSLEINLRNFTTNNILEYSSNINTSIGNNEVTLSFPENFIQEGNNSIWFFISGKTTDSLKSNLSLTPVNIFCQRGVLRESTFLTDSEIEKIVGSSLEKITLEKLNLNSEK